MRWTPREFKIFLEGGKNSQFLPEINNRPSFRPSFHPFYPEKHRSLKRATSRNRITFESFHKRRATFRLGSKNREGGRKKAEEKLWIARECAGRLMTKGQHDKNSKRNIKVALNSHWIRATITLHIFCHPVVASQHGEGIKKKRRVACVAHLCQQARLGVNSRIQHAETEKIQYPWWNENGGEEAGRMVVNLKLESGFIEVSDDVSDIIHVSLVIGVCYWREE